MCRKGKRTSVIAAPNWFDKVFEGAVYITGAALERGSAQPGQEKPASQVAFTCSQCGASILADGENRTVKCEHCDASIYLPDDLWSHLHPAPKKQRWFAGFKAEMIEDDE